MDNEQIVDNISKDGAKGLHEQRRRDYGEVGGGIEQGRCGGEKGEGEGSE